MEKVTCKEYMPASNNTVVRGVYFSNHKLIGIKYSDGKNEKEITPSDGDLCKVITTRHNEEIKRYEAMLTASPAANYRKKEGYNSKCFSKAKKVILFLSLIIIAASVLLWGMRNDDLVHFVRGCKSYSPTFLLLGLTLSIVVHIFIPRNIKTWSKKKKYYSFG